MLLFPLLNQPLHSTNLCRRQMLSGVGCISFRAIKTKPEVRLYVILRNAKTLHIEQTQAIPSLTSSTQIRNVLRRLEVPFCGKPIVLFYASTVFIFLPKFNLSVRIATLRSLSVPPYCLLDIDGSKPILFVSNSEPELRFRVALLRSTSQPLLSNRWVCEPGQQPIRELGRRMSLFH